MLGKNRTVDMTEGKILGKMLLFILPLIATNLMSNLYASVDAVIIGRSNAGTSALASIHGSGDVQGVLAALAVGLNTGTSLVIARYFGAKDRRNVSITLHTAFTFSIILGFVIMLSGEIFSPLLLKLIKTPPEIYNNSVLYLRIYFLAYVFQCAHTVTSGVIHASGNSTFALMVSIIGGTVNAVLDAIAVFVFDMGVAGVAIATVIAQAITTAMNVVKVVSWEEDIALRLRKFGIKWKRLGEIIGFGLPAMIQSICVNFSNIFVQRYINFFGYEATAGVGIAKDIDKYAGLCCLQTASGSAIFIRQNLGANKFKRAMKVFKTAILVSVSFALFIGAAVYGLAPVISKFLLKDSVASQKFCVDMVRVIMPLYCSYALYIVFMYASRAFGQARMTSIFAILSIVVARQVFLWLTIGRKEAALRSIKYIYYSYPVSFLVGVILLGSYFFLVIKPGLKIYKENNN